MIPVIINITGIKLSKINKMVKDTTQVRLDRIETKLDKMADAIISVARSEEKISTLMKDHEKMHERLNRFSQKLDDIEKKVEDNTRTVNLINKLFWIVTAALVTVLVKQFYIG